MTDRFPAAHAWGLTVEGGWSDDPRDPGGATYAGISQRAVVGVDLDGDGRADYDLDGDGDVDRDDILKLRHRVESGDAAAVALIARTYRTRYWAAIRGDDLPWPLSLAVYDAAINSGPGPAIVLLQRAAGVEPDGALGPATLAGARVLAGVDWIGRLTRERIALYARICERRLNVALDQQQARLALHGSLPKYVPLTRDQIGAAHEHAYAFLAGWMTRVALLAKRCGEGARA
jgi:hypothetical protein